MNRRRSREIAMALQFEMSINKGNFNDILDNYKENTEEDLKEIDFEYITNTLKGIQENSEAIDKKIEKYLVNWKISRLSKIDLAILRICTYEIMYEADIPNKVSVNEGIELAKKYSDDKSFQFINGVLDNINKETNI
ncbi:transcription antitermination factor NusB [Candidatus Clostridium radicumherbarum]|uniref:Transcription antitermination protein NusB n=1 Tax=Candidatus Clostridium radicumherbarum TaxID=3381662 RepID=A0ABW8TRP5_9CLOT